MIKKRPLLSLGFLVGLLVPSWGYGSEMEFLPVPANVMNVWVNGINNSGQVVGAIVDDAGIQSAAQWKNGEFSLLPGNHGLSIANAVNDSGISVGSTSDLFSRRPSPTMWVGSFMIELQTLGYGGVASAINSSGEIVGTVFTRDGQMPAIWRGTVLTVLSTPSNLNGKATGIDNQGKVSGIAWVPLTASNMAVQWVKDVPTLLSGNLGTVGDSCQVTITGAGKGFVSGHMREYGDRENATFAAVWRDRMFRLLDRIYGTTESYAMGMNNRGVEFGFAKKSADQYVPVRWNSAGALRLPAPEFASTAATCGNDTNLVAGISQDPDTKRWLPVLWRTDALVGLRMPNIQALPGQQVEMKVDATVGSNPFAESNVEFRRGAESIGFRITDAKGAASCKFTVPRSAPKSVDPICASMGGSNYVLRKLVIGKAESDIQVLSATAKRNSTVLLSVALRSPYLETDLAGRRVVFMLGDKQIGAVTTNSSGVGVLSFRVPTNQQLGSLKLVAQYAGDSLQEKTSGWATLTVVR